MKQHLVSVLIRKVKSSGNWQKLLTEKRTTTVPLHWKRKEPSWTPKRLLTNLETSFSQLETLKSYYDDQLYAIWSLIQLVEVSVVSCPPFKYGHSDFEAFKKIKEFLNQHILMRFKLIKDTKNIDLNSLVGLCTKIITRWNKKIETMENNQELKKQISAQKWNLMV